MNTSLAIWAPRELTSEEQEMLARLESVVDAELKSFVVAGNALAKINEARLYETSHRTFEAYCKERFGLSRRRGYQLMEAAEVIEDVCTMVHIPQPTNERQARPLALLPRNQRAAAWKEAVKEAGGKTPTAAVVTKIVDRRKQQAKEEPVRTSTPEATAPEATAPEATAPTHPRCWTPRPPLAWPAERPRELVFGSDIWTSAQNFSGHYYLEEMEQFLDDLLPLLAPSTLDGLPKKVKEVVRLRKQQQRRR